MRRRTKFRLGALPTFFGITIKIFPNSWPGEIFKSNAAFEHANLAILKFRIISLREKAVKARIDGALN